MRNVFGPTTAFTVIAAAATAALLAPAGAHAKLVRRNGPVPPIYKQCDPRWGNDVIGIPGNGTLSTVCRVGCAMSSVASLLASLGVTTAVLRPTELVNPHTLNKWLKQNGGYDCVDQFCFNLLPRDVRQLTPFVTFSGLESPPPKLSQVQKSLVDGTGAFVAHVHHSHHYVLVTGVDLESGSVEVMDPYYNTTSYPWRGVSDVLAFGIHTDIVPHSYPTFKQCDVRWGSDVIVSTTVCKVGCLMSSTAMALAGHAVDVDHNGSNPGSLNSWLRQHGGYTADNDFKENVLDNVSSTPDRAIWPHDGMHTSNDIPISLLWNYLSSARVVIANVMDGHHFVLVVGIHSDNQTLIVNDPGFNRTTYDYQKDVVGWRLFDMK